MAEIIRIALIGKTGQGKSSVGNTLLGEKIFSTGVCERKKQMCSSQIGKLPDGQLIKVVDTPGIETRSSIEEPFWRKEVVKAIAYLSPGPHAFLYVLAPGRYTDDNSTIISEMRSLFGDEFLNYTIIVMVRKYEIQDRLGIPIEIHDYIRNYANKGLKELYELCGKRIIAVENKTDSMEELQKYALNVASEIEKFEQNHYSHGYFQAMKMLKMKEDDVEKSQTEIKRLQEEIQRKIEEEKKDSVCTIS